MTRIAVLFDPEPESWGYRGDPFVWRELKERLGDFELPRTEQELGDALRQQFRVSVGADLDTLSQVQITRFAHGGMSSGMISGDYWRDRALPLLLQRYTTMRGNSDVTPSGTSIEDFDQKTINGIGHYVYCLIDPDGNRPFYVGEGKDNRVFQHARGALKDAKESDKIDTIRRIIGQGQEVGHVIIRHGIKSKDDALEIESALIDFASRFVGGLSNIAAGHHAALRGLMSVREIKQRYGAEPLTWIGKDCVIVNINRSYSRDMDSAGIYEVTRGDWPIGSRKVNVIRTVLADYRGLIVEVFAVDSWEQVPVDNGKMRWRFSGSVAAPEIRKLYIDKVFRKGSRQYPVAYNL
jgi:hypothetical protein